MVKYFNKFRIRLRNGSLISFSDGTFSTFNRAEAEQMADAYRSLGAECKVETFSSNVKIEDAVLSPDQSEAAKRAKIFSGKGLAKNAGHEGKSKKKEFRFNPLFATDEHIREVLNTKYKFPDPAFQETANFSKGTTTLPKEKQRGGSDDWVIKHSKYKSPEFDLKSYPSTMCEYALKVYNTMGFVESCRAVRSTYGLPNRMAKKVVAYAVDNM